MILALSLLAVPAMPLSAWVAWLVFNGLIAKWYGAEGLKSTPAVAEVFRPREWGPLISRTAWARSPGPVPDTDGSVVADDSRETPPKEATDGV
jgi:hypothetical protein